MQRHSRTDRESVSEILLATPPGLRVVLTLTAVVLTVLGGGLTFANHWMAELYGATESIAGTNGSRTAGAAILALGLLAWTCRKQELRVVRATVVPVLSVWFVLKSIVAYSAVVANVFRAPVGQIIFAFDVALAVIYCYYFFLMTRTQAGRNMTSPGRN